MTTGLLRIAAALFVALVSAGLSEAEAQVIFSDDFESYTNQASFNAVWANSNTSSQAPPNALFGGTLIDETYQTFIDLNAISGDPIELFDLGAAAFNPDDDGSTGQGVEYAGASGGGLVSVDLLPFNNNLPLLPTETKSIVLQGDIYDTGAYGNKRVSIGLRSASPAENLIEIGQWNSPDPTAYAGRAILFPEVEGDDPNPSWFFFDLDPGYDGADENTDVGPNDIGAVWSTQRVTVTPDTLTYEVDFNRNGINDLTSQPGFDLSQTFNITTSPNGYTNLRIGGPSGVSSPGPNEEAYGGVIFDNVSVALVDAPDPVLAGDYDNSGVVDGADYAVWAADFGSTADLDADGSGNGVVDAADYTVWRDNLPTSATAVPEPASVAMLGLAFAGLCRRRHS